MRKLSFIFFDAGGGHRAAANALNRVMKEQNRRFEIDLVNLQELLDEMDVFRKLTGIRMQDLYNLMLKKGWTLGSAQLMAGMHGVIRMFHGKQVRLLNRYWREHPTDMVVSIVPNFNRALWESLRQTLSGTPLITVLTDFADYPPHFWIEKQDQYFICGTEKAVSQALGMGHPKSKVFHASGMILNPMFYEVKPLTAEERAAERSKLGLDPMQPAGLVLFGGQGAAVMEEIAHSLDSRQLIAICGKNEKLAGRMRAMKRSAPMFVEGFTSQVYRYMQLADYFIGKPGPGSISEAAAMHLPIIVERNAWTLPQERYNAEWVTEMEVGIVLPNFRGIAPAVERMLQPAAYEKFRASLGKLNNRAVFEIPDVLERVLNMHSPAAAKA
jgi:1,2-diacylglycerol 3-beta-galactosyltransferase